MGKKKRKSSASDTGTLYSVFLTPVCHHRRPKNENELRIAIKTVLHGLNQLHNKGMLHYLLFVILQFLMQYFNAVMFKV